MCAGELRALGRAKDEFSQGGEFARHPHQQQQQHQARAPDDMHGKRGAKFAAFMHEAINDAYRARYRVGN